MTTERTLPGKPDKQRMQTTQQIFHNLLEIVELYPQYSVAQHVAAISRRKSSTGKDLFHWSDDELLKKIEAHKTELEGEDIMNYDDGEID
jgi:hypothetical protein